MTAHALRIEPLPSGVTQALCSCGAWHMRAGADALAVREEPMERLLERNHRHHLRDVAGEDHDLVDTAF